MIAPCFTFSLILPVLITLSQHKLWVFIGSGFMLVFSAWVMWHPGKACPVDSELNKLCNRTQVWNKRIYWMAVSIWGIGFFAAYLLYPLTVWWDKL